MTRTELSIQDSIEDNVIVVEDVTDVSILHDIPDLWNLVKIEEICKKQKEGIDPQKFPEEIFEYYSIPAFQEQIGPLRVKGKHILSIKLVVQNYTVLFGKLNPRVLKVWLVDSENEDRKIASTEFIPLIPSEEVFPKFVYYLCQSKFIVSPAKKLVSGSTPSRQRVDITSFYKIQVPLPPLPEQRAIVHILQTVQQAIQTRRKELELELERKAALMQHLFTHGMHNEPTKQSEIGEIPESWKVAFLSDLCSNNQGLIQTGPFGSQLHAYDYRDQGTPIVNPTHLGINTIVEENIPLIGQEDVERLARHCLLEGDILISRRGDFSRYSYISSKHIGWVCGTGCLLMRLKNPKVDNYFLSISIGSTNIQKYLSDNAVGSIMPNINTKILERMLVALPLSIEEQQDVASLSRACDTKIATLEKEITLHEELFRTLLEELMTGRISTLPLIEQMEKGTLTDEQRT